MTFLRKPLRKSLSGSLSGLVAAIFLMIGLAVSPAVLAAEANLSAQDSVEVYISTLLSRVVEIQPLYESDRESYFGEVEIALSAFVDFREVARGVMAKYGTGPNGATPEQLTRFEEVFKSSLIDFYGSALATYSGGQFEFLESRRPPKDPAVSSNVRMKIVGDEGSSIEVQYTMFLNEEKIWKLKNLYVEGINLRRQYYSRFDNMMASNDYNIDKVIDRWLIEQ